MTLNNCPLRRINQIYVIATKTKLNVADVKIPERLNDKYFQRVKRDRRKKTKGEEADIFAEKKEVSFLFRIVMADLFNINLLFSFRATPCPMYAKPTRLRWTNSC